MRYRTVVVPGALHEVILVSGSDAAVGRAADLRLS
jgi:hypothetical protein